MIDEDIEEECEVASCLVCDGPLVLLGQLGRRTHFRCRDCGLDQSVVS